MNTHDQDLPRADEVERIAIFAVDDGVPSVTWKEGDDVLIADLGRVRSMDDDLAAMLDRQEEILDKMAELVGVDA
jgi:hypothetical protein